MAVTNQPSSYPPSEFQTGLCDCCKDCKTCCYTCWCFPCAGYSIAKDMGESCWCGLSMLIRTVYRKKYNIKGSLCLDDVVVYCCCCCATCQLRRDIDRRKDQGTF